MRNALLLLGKDARMVARSPLLIATLVGYPLLVALIVALALGGSDRKPDVALVNLDESGRSVRVGSERLAVDDYLARLREEVDLVSLDQSAARRALDDGRVVAVLTLPEGFIGDLQSGVRAPVLRLETDARAPLEGREIRRRLEAAVYRFNQELAREYVDQVLGLVDLIIRGGDIGVFGRSGTVLGLERTRELVARIQRGLVAQGAADVARQLDPVLDFVIAANDNLDLAKPAANAIRAPIELQVSEGGGGRDAISAFGLAAALMVSLSLLGSLLSAAALASERDDNVLARLRRGLVGPGPLVAEKLLFAALAGLVVGLALLGAVAAVTDLVVGRWLLWIPTLLLAGLAFAAFGALAGAVARETRGALLATLMVALPLIVLGLLPGAVAGGLSAPMPFGPAFDAFQTLLLEPSVPGDLALQLGHLGLLGALLGAAAALALGRRRPA